MKVVHFCNYRNMNIKIHELLQVQCTIPFQTFGLLLEPQDATQIKYVHYLSWKFCDLLISGFP